MNLELVFWVITLREIFHKRHSEILEVFQLKKKVTAKSLFFVFWGFFVTKTLNTREVVKYIKLYPIMEYYVIIKNYFQRCFYVFSKTFF